MAYQIEVLIIKPELLRSVQSACDALNKVQDEFQFVVPKENLRNKLYLYQRQKYKSDEAFQWITGYRNEVKGNRPYIIIVVDGFLSSNRTENLFGTTNPTRDIAIFTTNNLTQFINDEKRFCCYYLTRYAISFLAPTIKSHDLDTDKDCIFHFKRIKKEIELSLKSGLLCDTCKKTIQPFLTRDIDDALKKLLLVVSNQHPYSIVLKGGGVKGIAFAGALLELENHFSFDAFAGTSAGAIAAVLLGAGYKPRELLKELREKDFNDFKDATILKAAYNLIIKKGLYPGDDIKNWMRRLLKRKIDQLNEVQLLDLPTRTIVYASRVKDGTLIFDSQGQRKDEHAAFAARCSMSIPYFFFPQQVSGVRVYDGGLKNNFPLKQFIDDNKQNPFIGLYLKSGAKSGGWVLGELFNVAIDGDEIETVDANIDKVVIIDPHPITTVDFNLNDDKKNFLELAGRVGALEFIAKYHTSISIDKNNLVELKKELEERRCKLIAGVNFETQE